MNGKQKQIVLRVLSFILSFVFIFSQNVMATAATTTTQSKVVSKDVKFIEKNGVKEYYEAGQTTPFYKENLVATNQVNTKSTAIKTNNVRKGALKAQLEALKLKLTQNIRATASKGLTAAQKKQAGRPKYVANELIVKFKANTSSTNKANAYKKLSLKTKKQLKSVNSEVVTIPKNLKVEDVVNSLRADINVEYAEPNYIFYPSSSNMTTDPRSNELWGLENIGQEIHGIAGINDMDIDIVDAWNITKGDSQIVVGVIDTGVDINHPDLVDNIWTNPYEIPGNGKDDDLNGYIDDIHGWDFFNKDNTVFDREDGDYHGTHVAGTIAASNNTIGVVGVAPNVKVMPIKFIGPNGGSTENAILAIEYAKKMGVRILNNSWGGDGFSQALMDAIQNSGTLFVAAAGNDSKNIDENENYPSNYACDNIITVAALNNTGNLDTEYSNYGVNNVDVAAPGTGILSTIPKKPGLGAAIATNNTFFQGFGLENIIDGSQRMNLIQKVLNNLGITAQDSILLVQDDASPTSSPLTGLYSSALTALGYTNVTTHCVNSEIANGPALATLNNYKLVIWFTGMNSGISSIPAITTVDQANLISYLNNGGKFYLSGVDAGWKMEASDLYTKYLHVKYLFEDANRPFVKGTTSSSFIGVTCPLMPTKYLDYLKVNPYNSDGSIDTTAFVALAYDDELTYDNSYDYYDGTSMATPHVSGIAALLLSKDIGQGPLTLKQKIMSSVVPNPSLIGFVKTGGAVNANNALNISNSETNDDIPGDALKDTITGALSAVNDLDDVYFVDLKAGDNIKLRLTGDNGTDFDMHLYGPDASTVKTTNGLILSSENEGSTEYIEYLVPNSGRYYVDVYAYIGEGNYNLSLEYGDRIIDDQNPEMLYMGNWVTTTGTNFENGTSKSINSVGNVNLFFQGSKIIWTGMKNSKQGIASVFIDGTFMGDVNLYSTTSMYKQKLFEANLNYGPHNMEIRWTGRWDRAARKSSTSINIDTLVVSTAKTPPVAPFITSYGAGISFIDLNFIHPSPEGVDYYKIYRSTDGTNFNLHKDLYRPAKPTSLTFKDLGIEYGTYYYKIVAVSPYGLESEASNVINVQSILGNSIYSIDNTDNNIAYAQDKWTVEANTAAFGGSFLVSSTPGATITFPYTGYELTLHFQASLDGGVVRIHYPTYFEDVVLNSSTTELLKTGTMSTARTVGGAITLECISGRVAFDCASIKDSDNEAPIAPVGLTAQLINSGATLNWIDNPEADVMGYNIFRAATLNDTYYLVNPMPIAAHSFLDGDLYSNTDYYYKIQAIDYAGHQSDLSAPVKFKQPPLPATQLAGVREANGIKLTWTNSNSTDVVGYNIYKSNTSGTGFTKMNTGTTLFQQPFLDGNAMDTSLDYYYYVTAVDQDGMESVKSNEVLVAKAVVTDIVTRVEDTSTDIKYTGTWSTWSNNGNSNSNSKYSSVKGNYIEFSFIGTGIKWITSLGTSRGIALVSIDNNIPIQVDCYSNTFQYQKAMYDIQNLPYGIHKIKIEVSGLKNTTSSNTIVNVDAFDIITPQTIPNPIVSRVEESDINATYNGTWALWNNSGNSNVSSKYSSVKGNYMEFSFIGTGIKWITSLGTSRGIALVSIDNNIPIQVDCYSNTFQYQKAMYDIQNLSYGTHKIKIEVSGLKNANSANILVNLDAFDISTFMDYTK